MSKSIVHHVQEWHARNDRRLSDIAVRLHVKVNEPGNLERGSISMGVEALSVIGSVTFWNNGNVTATAIHKPSKREIIIDDRALSPSDDVDALLDRYFNAFARLEKEPVEKWAFRLPPNWGT